MSVRKQVSVICTPKILNFNPSKSINIIEEGVYKAKLKNIEMSKAVSTRMGMTDRIKTTFELSYDGSLVYQNILLIPGKTQLVGQLVFAMTGEYDEVDLFKLIGSEVGIEIKHNKTDQGMVFTNIVSIFNADELEETSENNYEDDENENEYDDNGESNPNDYEEIDC